MRRRSRSAVPAIGLVVLTVVLATGSPASATISSQKSWDVALTAKETTTWSFSGLRPDSCTQYLGVPSVEAKGSGSYTRSAATTKKRPLWAETYRVGRKLRFSSFATDGWSIPATASKSGTASTQAGKPCDWSPGDPEPLPSFVDASGCRTAKGTTDPTLTWTPGELVVRLGSGPPAPSSWIRCPDTGEPTLYVSADPTCGPKEPGAIYLSALKFMLPKPKEFTVRAKHRDVCPTPMADWLRGGTASLTIERSTSYEVTFTPRKR